MAANPTVCHHRLRASAVKLNGTPHQVATLGEQTSARLTSDSTSLQGTDKDSDLNGADYLRYKLTGNGADLYVFLQCSIENRSPPHPSLKLPVTAAGPVIVRLPTGSKWTAVQAWSLSPTATVLVPAAAWTMSSSRSIAWHMCAGTGLERASLLQCPSPST